MMIMENIRSLSDSWRPGPGRAVGRTTEASGRPGAPRPGRVGGRAAGRPGPGRAGRRPGTPRPGGRGRRGCGCEDRAGWNDCADYEGTRRHPAAGITPANFRNTLTVESVFPALAPFTRAVVRACKQCNQDSPAIGSEFTPKDLAEIDLTSEAKTWPSLGHPQILRRLVRNSLQKSLGLTISLYGTQETES